MSKRTTWKLSSGCNPKVKLAYNDGFDARTLRELLEIVELNRERIERAWNEFFGSGDSCAFRSGQHVG
jgi:hypothetical protein